MNKHNNELNSIELTNKLFNQLINSSLSKIQYISLSSNPTLNTEQIKCLFLEDIDNVNINLLRNKNCPENKIEEFLLMNDKIYNIAIAHNEHLSQKHITILSDLNDPDVQFSLEFNNHL